MAQPVIVSSAAELVAAAQKPDSEIEVAGVLSGMPMLILAPGVALHGGQLRFGAKGVRLSRNNTLSEISIETAAHEVAICNDPEQSTLGALRLEKVRTVGQVLLTAEGAVRGGHVEVDGLTIVEADLRGRAERPRAYGVEAMQGAFTLWNRQQDRELVITARLNGISAGAPDRPIRGSGVFVVGSGADGGRVRATLLRSGEIHTDGGIAPGTPDLISGGVFVLAGAEIDEVINDGPVTTYGQNDMVLDNWGEAGVWIANAPVRSHGPSGIGFVNFGRLGRLEVRAPLETSGAGARGFNLYDGALQSARFRSITTTGDGAIGIQLARLLPELEIEGDLSTRGGEGLSLVKGVQTRLKATALSVQEGGHIGRLAIGGKLETSGDDVVTLDLDGDIDEIDIAGGISAAGRNSDAVRRSHSRTNLDRVSISAAQGSRIVSRS